VSVALLADRSAQMIRELIYRFRGRAVSGDLYLQPLTDCIYIRWVGVAIHSKPRVCMACAVLLWPQGLRNGLFRCVSPFTLKSMT
jgi:hypothetical protein